MKVASFFQNPSSHPIPPAPHPSIPESVAKLNAMKALVPLLLLAARAAFSADLSGIWANTTLTPLERGVVRDFAGKLIELPPVTRLTITDSEAKPYEKALMKRFSFARGDRSEADLSGELNPEFTEIVPELLRIGGKKRTSLIVDPADGKVPYKLSEKEREELEKSRPKAEGLKGFTLGDRCLFTELSGPPIMPFEVNSNYQIVETPDSVMILLELFHEVRIVRLHGTHAPASVRSWNGDSIGHYEHGTLVVDTTNFNGKWRRSGEHLHVVERFTRIDSKTILYRATQEDPTVYTRPWTIEYLFHATKGPIYEYGCHEGNYALPTMLSGRQSAVQH